MNAIEFAVVSPEREVRSGVAQLVVIPAEEGEMGVMAGHQPLVAAIKPGIVVITGEGGRDENIFVRGGFAEATPGRVQILAEDAEALSEMTAESLAERRRAAEAAASAGGDELARAAAAAEIEKIAIMQAAL